MLFALPSADGKEMDTTCNRLEHRFNTILRCFPDDLSLNPSSLMQNSFLSLVQFVNIQLLCSGVGPIEEFAQGRVDFCVAFAALPYHTHPPRKHMFD